MKPLFSPYNPKACLFILAAFLPLFNYSQQKGIQYSSGMCEDILTGQESDSLARFKKGRVTFYYPDKKMKYAEDRKEKKRYIVYYNTDGSICKEQHLNYGTRISKTIFFENGKKVMVCKGTLK